MQIMPYLGRSTQNRDFPGKEVEMKPLVILAACALVVGCTSGQYGGSSVVSGPAANPTGSVGPQSGQPANMGGYTGVVSAPAANPTGSNTPQSGQPSNMGAPAAGFSSAPARNPTGSNTPQSGQPSNAY